MTDAVPTAASAADTEAHLPEESEEDAIGVQTAIQSAEGNESTFSDTVSRSESRHRLLSALKPYVSKDRSRALDSMEAIANILEMLRS